jgi:hypothetical protein
MALRKFVEHLTKSTDDVDRDRLRDWSGTQESEPLDQLELRKPVRMAGEVRSVRIIPRAGADALEVHVSDGRGSVTAVFLGRRRIAGLGLGRRIILEGVAVQSGSQRFVYNPLYTLV